MAERIPDTILTEIRARLSIVEFLSAYVALRKTGRNYVGLCPFHSEHTPSFSVNDDGGFFHCFGCGVGGNVFTFLTRIEGISFPEAVRRLAAKAGVSLPQAEQDPRAQERAQLHKLNALATTYFQRCLWGNAGGITRQYLAERGLSKEIAQQFRLGFAPSWNTGLARFLAGQGADLEKAAALGLVGKRTDGQYYDKFRHRLIFPITDSMGRIVAFGGRLLPVAQEQPLSAGPARALPKYLNSPESVLYKKGSVLYGLFQAKDAMRRGGRVLVVEGYIDLLALVQYGYSETVAVLGTALGVEQLKLLRRFTSEIYIFFDGDEAGRRAATRAFPLCVEAELQGKGVFLPQGYDPDTFVREHGQAKLSELIDQAEPLEDFYFARHAPPPGASAFQRAQAAREALTVLKPMTDVVARGALLTQIAQRFGVNEEELRSTAASQDAPRAQPPSPAPRREVQSPQVIAEAELIQLMLIERRAATRVAAEGVVSAFQQWKDLAADIITAWEQTGKLDLGAFLDRLPKAIADRVTKAYARTVEDPEEEQERERLLRDCIAKIRTAQRKSERERLRWEIREAEQKGDEAALKLRLQRLQQKGTAAEEDKEE
ncbi:MAG TPA: DNA primase [Candidatus Binatia bacterium]|jgi:DNA primase|nr:DNA primase [Candidatus Binatia bacterium]